MGRVATIARGNAVGVRHFGEQKRWEREGEEENGQRYNLCVCAEDLVSKLNLDSKVQNLVLCIILFF